MTYLKAFTTQAENFFTELTEMFPHDKNIKIAQTSLMFIKKTNPRKLLELFKYYIYRYETKIMQRDESFFLQRSFDDDMSEYVKSLNAVTDLKDHWCTMSEKTKDSIWMYFIVLIKLSKKA